MTTTPSTPTRQTPPSGVITPERNQNALASRFCSITKHLHHPIINQLHVHRSFISSEPFAAPPFKAGAKQNGFVMKPPHPWFFNTKGGFHFSEIEW
jgi:hypothetical protein